MAPIMIGYGALYLGRLPAFPESTVGADTTVGTWNP